MAMKMMKRNKSLLMGLSRVILNKMPMLLRKIRNDYYRYYINLLIYSNIYYIYVKLFLYKNLLLEKIVFFNLNYIICWFLLYNLIIIK